MRVRSAADASCVEKNESSLSVDTAVAFFSLTKTGSTGGRV